MPQLSKYVDLAYAAITATTTDVLILECDTVNAEGVMFLTNGTSAKVTITLKHAASTTATFVAVASAAGTSCVYATSAAKAFAAMDVHKPVKRWLQATFTSTGNSYFAACAFKYGLRKLPKTWSSTSNLPTTGGGVLSVISPASS